jgi:hypothetical protein
VLVFCAHGIVVLHIKNAGNQQYFNALRQAEV